MVTNQKIKLLNIQLDSVTKEELLGKLTEGILFTPNVDHLVKLQKDREFYHAYQQADFVVCDSRIVNGAAFLMGLDRVKEIIPGSELFPSFCAYHQHNEQVKIFLLGAGEGVALEAMKRINSRIGRKIVVGAHSPSFGFEKNAEECDAIVDLINATEANVLVVGVGAPKQEKWIVTHREKIKNIQLFMALGATIDFEAGKVKRAPNWYRKAGLEWFYRLLVEPRRLWKRYLIDDMPFFMFLARQRLKRYKNPFAS